MVSALIRAYVGPLVANTQHDDNVAVVHTDDPMTDRRGCEGTGGAEADKPTMLPSGGYCCAVMLNEVHAGHGHETKSSIMPLLTCMSCPGTGTWPLH